MAQRATDREDVQGRRTEPQQQPALMSRGVSSGRVSVATRSHNARPGDAAHWPRPAAPGHAHTARNNALRDAGPRLYSARLRPRRRTTPPRGEATPLQHEITPTRCGDTPL